MNFGAGVRAESRVFYAALRGFSRSIFSFLIVTENDGFFCHLSLEIDFYLGGDEFFVV